MNIQDYRNLINEIDRDMARVFENRMRVALEIAKYKKSNGMPVFDPKREQAVVRKQMEAVSDELSAYTHALYQTLFDVSRSYQHAYLAKEAGWVSCASDAAQASCASFPKHALIACEDTADGRLACGRLSEDADIRFLEGAEAVWQAVENGDCPYGMVAVENDAVDVFCDLLQRHGCFLVQSITADDGEQNSVRFGCISRKLEIYPNDDRICLKATHQPGAFYCKLARFSAQGIHPVRLKSRPACADGSRLHFDVELQASMHGEAFRAFASEMAQEAERFVLLGSYAER